MVIEAPDAVLLLLAAAIAVAGIASRIRVPVPVMLVLTGFGAGAIWHAHPGLGVPRLSPDTMLLLFLPPLLTRAAFGIPLDALRQTLLPVTLLAVGLVLASMVVAAGLLHLLLPALPWGLVLLAGAILAPPDPVAATAIADKTGLPHRLVTILEGEGLLNDAVAIVAFQIALEATASGGLSLTTAAGRLAWEAPAGIVIGAIVGFGAVALRRRIDDVPLEAGITFLLPYVAYRLADRFHASAVLAAVVLGLMLRRRSTRIASPAARISARAIWGMLDFAIMSLVFLLVGMELGLMGLRALTWSRIGTGLLVGLALLLLRLFWMLLVPPMVHSLPSRRYPAPTAAESTVMAWAGMRGVVSVALTLAIPRSGAGAEEQRWTLIVVCLVAVVATLLLQGSTLLPLVNLVGAGDADRERRDEVLARSEARNAARRALAPAFAEGNANSTIDQLTKLVEDGDVGVAGTGFPAGDVAVLERVLEAQRQAIAALRGDGRIGERLAGRLETELDADLLRLRGDLDRLAG